MQNAQSKNSQGLVAGLSKVSHFVVTMTGFTLPFETLRASRVSTNFCTLFAYKANELDICIGGGDRQEAQQQSNSRLPAKSS